MTAEIVIWATDGSQTADHALPVVEDLARGGAKVIVLQCTEILAGSAPGFPVTPQDLERVAKVRRQAEQLRKKGFDAELVVRGGPSAEVAYTIADFAAETCADLIVVGTHGRGPVAGTIFGSVTQQLLHCAPCPVLVVPDKAQHERRRSRRSSVRA